MMRFSLCIYLLYTGARNSSLLPFPLSADFISNYRRMYGPVQLTSLTAEITASTAGAIASVPAASDDSPTADARHFKGKHIYFKFHKYPQKFCYAYSGRT